MTYEEFAALYREKMAQVTMVEEDLYDYVMSEGFINPPNPPGSPGAAPVHPAVGRMQDQPDPTKKGDK